MELTLTVFAFVSALIWLVILLLPWQPWRNNEILDVDPQVRDTDLSDVTVVIPARDEAAVINIALSALLGQGKNLHVILVDDGSTDGTAEIAENVGGLHLTVISGQPLPPGWSGKLWAMEQGVRIVETRSTLLLDADIRLGAGVISALKDRMIEDNRQFVSIMASLRMKNRWEKLLMPAFIYFFKMLYPFRLAKNDNKRFYSAAGGCILLETRIFKDIGGLEVVSHAVIDDCALAKQVKNNGYRIWIGQSRDVDSVREYEHLGVAWDMIARTAYSQLSYSPFILFGLSAVMVTLFWLPVLGLFYPDWTIRILSLLAWVEMTISYLPTIRYYGLHPAWAMTMPLIGTLYLAMTWSSAFRYWRGERTKWKGRVYS